MAMAATFERTTARPLARLGATGIARVAVMRDMAEVEAAWRTCGGPDFLATPYQRFELLAAWQAHIGSHDGVRPFVVVAYDAADRPLMLLPLAIGRENGVTVARFMGGKHPTYNMAVWRRVFAASATMVELGTLTAAIRDQAEGIDVLAFTQQPRQWRGIANPFAQFAGQPSPNLCPRLTMTAGGKPEDRISTSTRRRLRNKERKLQTLPGYRYLIAATDAEINRILDAFFIIKPQRMALSGLPDVFSDDAIRGFIREACLSKLPDGRRTIELHALECDSELISIFACVADGERFSTMFNTYTVSDSARYSPGLILLRYMIDHYAELGYSTLDFGVGSDDYKLTFCKEDEPIFDSFIPLTTRGRLVALGMSSMARAKRLIKQNPTLAQMAQQMRNAFQR